MLCSLATLLALWGLVGYFAKAEVLLIDSGGSSLSCSKSYPIQIASKLDFAPVSGPALFVGDQCNFNLKSEDVPIGAIVFYWRSSCDEGVPLQGFVSLRDKIVVAIELYGSEGAVIQRTSIDQDPFDLPPRFQTDPRPAKQNLISMRIHGSDAGKAAQFLARGNVNFTANVTSSPDPWNQMIYTPQWLVYQIAVIVFFCGYIPQHAVRSLIFIARTRRRMPMHARMNGLNLQTVMMGAALVLGFLRTTEYTTSCLRDYATLWSPELVSQLCWGYCYYILLMSMLLLVLFWSDVLKTSRVKLLMIDRATTKFYVIFGAFALVVLTIFIVLFVLEVPGTKYVRSAGFLLLGSIALLESIGVMIYGGRLLKQLTDVKPIAERAGALQRSPSLGNEQELNSTENPSFDPSMNSSQTKSSRLSFVRQLSSPKSTAMSSEDSEDKRAARMAQKRAKPLTRLVIASAALLFVATCLSAAAAFTSVLNSPVTYIVIFFPLAAIEISIYALVIHTMSPIWQERRKRFARSDSASESKLMPLSEGRAMSLEEVARQESCFRKLFRCLSNWCVL